MSQLLAFAALGALLCSSRAAAYSFVSCTDYDEYEDVCYGYTRNYGYQAPLASHAYNLQANLPTGANQNAVSVDPTIQVRCASDHTPDIRLSDLLDSGMISGMRPYCYQWAYSRWLSCRGVASNQLSPSPAGTLYQLVMLSSFALGTSGHDP